MRKLILIPTMSLLTKHRQPSTEARVIRELHRHGIYW